MTENDRSENDSAENDLAAREEPVEAELVEEPPVPLVEPDEIVIDYGDGTAETVDEASGPETASAAEAPAYDTPAATAPPVFNETIPAEAVPVSYDAITPASEPETLVMAQTTPVDHPYQEVIIVEAPVPPTKRGNRLAGLGFSLLASIVFAALFAAAVFVIRYLRTEAVDIAFLANINFYWPVVLFFAAMVIITIIVNNAGWWTYIFTSVLVGAAVYFGAAAIILLISGVGSMTQQEATAVYFAGLADPITIAAGLIAREVAIWTGAILGRRGRKVRVRNAEAREAYEREQAELTPTA